MIGNRNVERGEETVSIIRKAGGAASFQQTNVLVAAEIESLVEHAVKTCGRLDVAFNNAGIEGDVKPTLIDHNEASFDAIMGVNVKGVWLSMKYEIHQMLKTGGGAIVNCSSVAGVIGFPGIGIYSASKHAVVGLTKAAALEFSEQGIRVNAVNPAVIDTEMVDRLAARRLPGLHSSVSFCTATTFLYTSNSAAICAANCSGVLPTTSDPVSSMRFFTAGGPGEAL